MNKLKMHSPDLTQANIDKLAELFPNCVVEAADANGVIKRSIDFDQLRQELSSAVVDGPQERFQLSWPGKREALLTANAPIAKTLRPCRGESVDFDSTNNLFIEGDNLDALKLLQETYLNKVKLIYIDPPYNTGNDFIYEDDFAEDAASYFLRSNQQDESGNKLIANGESNGRFHSDWLNMIYPRIKLARNLLRDDGVLFVSIGDDEQASLKKMCDELFGIQNFLACIVRKTKLTSNKGAQFSPSHEYILAYSKDILHANEFNDANAQKSEKYLALFKHSDTRGKYNEVSLYMPALKGDRPSRYFIDCPDGSKVIPPGNRFWRWSETTFFRNKSENRVIFKKTTTSPLVDESGKQAIWNIYTKIYLHERLEAGLRPGTFIMDWPNSLASKEFIKMGIPFPYAKPWQLIKHLIEISENENDGIVLDFFSGSGTTAHAVMHLNAEDGGSRRFILVQMPEVCEAGSEAHKGGYKNIAEIGMERIRKVGSQLKTSADLTSKSFDAGFRVLKVDSSNMKEVFYTPDAVNQDQLAGMVNNIREDRTAEDLLFQVLLDWGVDLALPIAKETIEGKTVYFVDGNALAACFDEGVSEEFVKLLAKREPLRAVFRDSGYATDSVKINVEQLFKLMSPSTDIKTI